MGTTTKKRTRHRRRSEAGSASAELVVATPLLFLLIFAVIQFALWQHAAHVAAVAAQQGLAAARVQGGSAADGRAQVETVLAQVGSGVLVDPQVSATLTVTTVLVAVTGYAEPVLPFLHLPVTAHAAGPVERWVPATP